MGSDEEHATHSLYMTHTHTYDSQASAWAVCVRPHAQDRAHHQARCVLPPHRMVSEHAQPVQLVRKSILFAMVCALLGTATWQVPCNCVDVRIAALLLLDILYCFNSAMLWQASLLRRCNATWVC